MLSSSGYSLYSIFAFLFILCSYRSSNKILCDLVEEEYGVKNPTLCEACKFLAIELQDRFEKLGQTSGVVETGYNLDIPRKKVKYTKSEVYFIDAQEDVCEKILEYNVHKERTDSTRFAKGMSSTFTTLHKLVDKGVKVDLGIPYELWDTPSAEVTALKQQCEDLLEKNQYLIEEWYMSDRNDKLVDYLCKDNFLPEDQQACLHDPPAPPSEEYISKPIEQKKDSEKKRSDL